MKGGNDDMMDLWRSRSPGRPVFASMRVRSRVLRICRNCGWFIWPQQRHHRIERPEGSFRRHIGRCPGDPYPCYTPADAWMERVNTVLAAFAMLAFAAAMCFLAAVMGGWRP